MIKKQKRIRQSQPWRTEICFASLEIKSHWKAWILNYVEFNTGCCMSGVEQTTRGPVLWPTAVPKTGGALGVLAQLCLSFIRTPAHHAQPFQRMQNLLGFQRSRICLIPMMFKMYLNTLKNKSVFKHTNIWCAELCQENNDSFSLQLLEVNNRDRQCTHLHCQLAFIF